MNIEAAKRFIIENARPVELASYRALFERGDKRAVVDALRAYQNPDGGFGHALEADNWNELSNPIATNDALITLHRAGALDEAGDMLEDIARYLFSHDSFDRAKRRWLFAVDSNMNAPHAAWWEKKGDGIEGFNPTVSLACAALCLGGDAQLYGGIVREAFDETQGAQSGDSLKCYLLAVALLEKYGRRDVIDMEKAQNALRGAIEKTVCKDISKYGVEYATVPSDFFCGCYEAFFTDALRPYAEAELRALDGLQQPDGGFDVTWRWYNDYPEFAQARAWWRPRITLEKLLFARFCEAYL